MEYFLKLMKDVVVPIITLLVGYFLANKDTKAQIDLVNEQSKRELANSKEIIDAQVRLVNAETKQMIVKAELDLNVSLKEKYADWYYFGKQTPK